MIHTRYYTRCVICAAGMRRGLWAVGFKGALRGIFLSLAPLARRPSAA